MQQSKPHYDLTDRFMGCFAIQANDNSVIGIHAGSLVRSLLLFEQCIMATIRLDDVLELLRYVSPNSLIELIQSGALQFYFDSSTAAEIGGARHSLNLTGNTAPLKTNEFSFCIIKGHDKNEFAKALNRIETHPSLAPADRSRLAQTIETALLPEHGRPIHEASFRDFYADLRSGNIDVVRSLVRSRMAKLGIKARKLVLDVDEFVSEDFRVNSNLIQRFGLSEAKTRDLTLRALHDLLSVYIRTHHMRELSRLIGLNETEQQPWHLKVDKLIAQATSDLSLENDFVRVLTLYTGAHTEPSFTQIDLNGLMKLRSSDDLVLFRKWLKDSRRKTDKEIQEQFNNVRAKLGNALQSTLGKTIRFFVGAAMGQIQAPSFQIGSQVWSAADAFLLDRMFGRDPALGIISKDYPALFR